MGYEMFLVFEPEVRLSTVLPWLRQYMSTQTGRTKSTMSEKWEDIYFWSDHICLHWFLVVPVVTAVWLFIMCELCFALLPLCFSIIFGLIGALLLWKNGNRAVCYLSKCQLLPCWTMEVSAVGQWKIFQFISWGIVFFVSETWTRTLYQI